MEERLPNPSDERPATRGGAKQRKEIESFIPAGPAVPATAQMMKGAGLGMAAASVVGLLVGAIFGVVLMLVGGEGISVLLISLAVGTFAGATYGFVNGGVIGAEKESREQGVSPPPQAT